MKISEEIQKIFEMPDPMQEFWRKLWVATIAEREAECNRVLGIKDNT